MPRSKQTGHPYRIDAFLAEAMAVHTSTEAQRLSNEELAWIYDTHPATHMPKKIIAAYRKALKEAGLIEWFIERTVTVSDGDSIVTESGKLKGFFREREEVVKARRAAYDTGLDTALTYGADVQLLDGHEQRYLDTMATLCMSSNWEDAAVGVLMATGRRTIEVCLQADMRPLSTPYHVDYSGQAKTCSEERKAEFRCVPVLLPETRVCDALTRVQDAVQLELREDDDMDAVIGRRMRHAVARLLGPVFPHATTLSPRTCRNCFVAIGLEAVTPQGMPLALPKEDADHFIRRVLGQLLEDHRPADAYKREVLPRLRRNIVLPA